MAIQFDIEAQSEHRTSLSLSLWGENLACPWSPESCESDAICLSRDPMPSLLPGQQAQLDPELERPAERAGVFLINYSVQL